MYKTIDNLQRHPFTANVYLRIGKWEVSQGMGLYWQSLRPHCFQALF